MPSSFPLSAPIDALYFFCMPARRTGPRQWIAILSGDQILAGARRCLCLRRTLFAGGRQLLQLSLLVDSEPANHDCCELVPEHLRLRQESLDLGSLAGVELLADHECQVLFDGAERLVGGREAEVRRLWRPVAIGGGSGGFGHGFPYKTSFCDLPGDFRCWLDWPGRPNCGRATRVEAVQVTLLHGFRSGHLHGSDGFVGLVLVGIEIYDRAGARGAPAGGFLPRK